MLMLQVKGISCKAERLQNEEDSFQTGLYNNKSEFLWTSTGGSLVRQSMQETIVSLLTAAGRGALAVIAVQGHSAIDAAERFFVPLGKTSLRDRVDGALAYGRWGGERGEQLLIVRRSVESLEIHCHGGLAACEAIVRDLESIGCQRIAWQERRSVSIHGSSRIEAEALHAISKAGGIHAAKILAWQLSGALEKEIQSIVALLQDSLQVVESDLDLVKARLNQLLESSHVGCRLITPWRIVLSGEVNVGKSSLMNAMAGYSRSIVSEQPGTTRDLVEMRVVFDGWEFDVCDTAGERLTSRAGISSVEKEGIERATTAVANADLVLRVIDIKTFSTQEFSQMEFASGQLIAVSKSDLDQEQGENLRILQESYPKKNPKVVCTSATSGAGINELIGAIVSACVPLPPRIGSPVVFTNRQLELISKAASQLPTNVEEAIGTLREVL